VDDGRLGWQADGDRTPSLDGSEVLDGVSHDSLQIERLVDEGTVLVEAGEQKEVLVMRWVSRLMRSMAMASISGELAPPDA
jgi:hypothetical protein